MMTQNIGPVSPALIPRLSQGRPNYPTQTPGPCMPVAAALLGSLSISPVPYSMTHNEPLSYCTYQNSHGEVRSVIACINSL